MDNRQANIHRFEAEMTKVTRDGVDKLMAFIRKSDMYAAPASTRFHLSVTGRLLQHSLNVLDALSECCNSPPVTERWTVAALTQCTGCTEGEPHKER